MPAPPKDPVRGYVLFKREKNDQTRPNGTETTLDIVACKKSNWNKCKPGTVSTLHSTRYTSLFEMLPEAKPLLDFLNMVGNTNPALGILLPVVAATALRFHEKDLLKRVRGKGLLNLTTYGIIKKTLEKEVTNLGYLCYVLETTDTLCQTDKAKCLFARTVLNAAFDLSMIELKEKLQ